MVILLDTSIILDYFLKRPAFFHDAEIIMKMIAASSLKGILAAHTISNAHYIMRKEFTDYERRQLLLSLFETFDVIALDKNKLISALEKDNFADFEDCLQYECAAEVNADFIITRNKEDFATSCITVLTPDEFLKLRNCK